MKKLYLFAILLLGISVVRAQDPVKVAVMDLKARSGIDNMTVSSLTDFVCTTILDVGEYDVIGKDDMKTMMEHIADRQLLDCDDTHCLAKIGGALGVQLLVSGNIGMVGRMYLINIKLIDIDEAVVRNRVSEKYLGDETGLVSKVEESIHKLFGDIAGDAAASAPDNGVAPSVPASAEPVAAPDVPPEPAARPAFDRMSFMALAGANAGAPMVDEAYYEDLHRLDGENYDYGSNTGLFIGTRMQLNFSRTLGLGIELALSRKNYYDYSLTLDTSLTSNVWSVTRDIDYRLEYLTIAVLPNLQLGPLYGLAGLEFGILLDAASEGTETVERYDAGSSSYVQDTYDINDDQNDTRSGGALALVLGGGVSYNKLLAELRFNIGLTDIVAGDSAVSPDGYRQSIRMFTLQLIAGYRF